MPPTPTVPDVDADWWRGAVIYQVYIRSFADADGDGLGDIAGLRAKLGYLADLGVDALWINPWYPSPMADAGYDVADHRGVEPRFGTLETATELIDEAHAHGLRVLLDLVPNHVSHHHEWFVAALASPPGSPERERFLFRDGRGPTGAEPPNDWRSEFGGPAWTRTTDPDGTPGQWYLHLFSPEQPDLNWSNPEVGADVEATLRFWFDRGVDGFRIDVAHSLVKAEGLPDIGGAAGIAEATGPTGLAGQPEAAPEPGAQHPHWDLPGVHDIYRRWRAVADGYDPPRVFVAEAWVAQPERLARYVRADELHTAFNFDFLVAPWLAGPLRRTIDETIAEHAVVGAPPTWVLSNHDVARHVSRYARPQIDDPDDPVRFLDQLLDRPNDPALGLRRARAAALLMLALPGGAYVYQGEELGLPEVEDLPTEVLQDPIWERSKHRARGRDGCRVPIPWSGSEAPFGFSPPGATAEPWLPQPATWSSLAADRQADDPSSTLSLYRAALAVRRSHPALGDGTLRWLDAPVDVLAFARDPGFVAIVNLGGGPIEVLEGASVLLSSDELAPDGRLPPDTAVWLATT